MYLPLLQYANLVRFWKTWSRSVLLDLLNLLVTGDDFIVALLQFPAPLLLDCISLFASLLLISKWIFQLYDLLLSCVSLLSLLSRSANFAISSSAGSWLGRLTLLRREFLSCMIVFFPFTRLTFKHKNYLWIITVFFKRRISSCHANITSFSNPAPSHACIWAYSKAMRSCQTTAAEAIYLLRFQARLNVKGDAGSGPGFGSIWEKLRSW